MKAGTVLTLLALWLSLTAASPVFAPGFDGSTLPQKLDALMSGYAETQFFSGVLLVAKDDAVIYQKAFGMADRERGVPNDLATRYNIASMGKTFTAVLVMQLVEQGKLSLDTPIRAYLPEYRIPNADKITIRHLLTHTSGLSNYMLHPRFEARRAGLKTLDDVMALVADVPLTFGTPGERFAYSNSGFIVLGRIIEKITGKPYVSFVRERLWAPLGMDRTSIDHPPVINPPAEAVPYYAFSRRAFVNGLSDENPAFSDGGAFSCARDLFVFARALMTDRLLKPETRALMLTPQVVMDAQTKYGCGWFVYENLSGRRWVGHSGGGHGYSADLKISLDDGYVIILLANVRTPSRKITENVVKLLETGQYDAPQMTLESYLFGEMEERGIEAVLADLKSALARRGEEKLPSPSILVGVADALSALKRQPEALRVLERDAQLFPASAIPYSAMGETYASMGKREDAVGCFHKALAIDPKDPYSAMRLKTLESSPQK